MLQSILLSKNNLIKKTVIVFCSIFLFFINSIVNANPSISAQTLLAEWQHYQAIEKQADDMWENSAAKQSLRQVNFQDKAEREKLIRNIRQENLKIQNVINQFQPKSEAVNGVLILKKAILSKFEDLLIHQIELSSQHLTDDDSAQQLFLQLQYLLNIYAYAELEVKQKIIDQHIEINKE